MESNKSSTENRMENYLLYLTNDMEQTCYDACLSHLYDYLDFEVLSMEDIRRVDLAEKAISRIKTAAVKLKLKTDEIIPYYVSILGLYVQMKIKCTNESRADQYRKLAFEKIGLIKKNHENYSSLLDSLVIFLSLFRISYQFLNKPNVMIKDLDIGISLDDLEIIEWIKNKTSVPIVVGKEMGRTEKKSGIGTVYSKANQELFYIMTLLLFFHLLSEFGYSEEGSNG